MWRNVPVKIGAVNDGSGTPSINSVSAHTSASSRSGLFDVERLEVAEFGISFEAV
jgi:hypothetical protein